jgi:DNA adenine methylase
VKPPIPYYGGKQRIADRIVATFPEHLHYVEPYAGGLSVFLAKDPSRIETLNDLDHDLVTFWRVLRDRPEDLMRACALTPHSRTELDICRQPMGGLDELEVARRVWSQLAQGRSGRRTRTGWRFYVDGAATRTGMAGYLAAYVDRMPPAADRLSGVQIECKPALEVIDLYGRAADTLLYVDPPYLASTRRSLQYLHEMHTEAQHAELAEALRATAAAVVLSGYHSDAYDRWYSDWNVIEIPASTQQSGLDSRRTEVLWCNFEPARHLLNEEVS